MSMCRHILKKSICIYMILCNGCFYPYKDPYLVDLTRLTRN